MKAAWLKTETNSYRHAASIFDLVLKIYFRFPSFLTVGIFGDRGEEDSEQKQCCEVWQGWEVGGEQP